ncbi:winged helix DNA-binding domain-containing protein [Aquihabitans sp. McL0605]|uniref:winged helix DNA-binding domain-containing protein n=1 Tax=Aquihabitans sp. McL0605 TaxID=3415671 RepID=UPI003CEC0DAB
MVHAQDIATKTAASAPSGPDDGALRAARLGAQLLTDRCATTPEQVVEHLLAVQAQDARAARLSVRARSTGLTAADVDAALTERQTMVVGWLHRTTLHLVPAADYWWLHQLLSPRQVTSSATRLRQEGVDEVDAERGVDLIAGTLRDDGPQTRDQLRARLDAAGIPTAGQALVHLQLAASIAGHLVRGPMVGDQQAFVHAPTWLGEPEPEDRDLLLARLAERYLVGHGPADAKDLVKWTGLALGACRQGLAAIADRTEPSGPDGRVRLADRPVATELPTPRLLGGFDPILHGWVAKDLFVTHLPQVVTTNGIFRPTALVDGQVVATWSPAGARVTLKPLAGISVAAMDALQADADDIARYLAVDPRPITIDALRR